VGALVAVAVLAASAAAQDFAFAARVGDSHHPLAAGTTNLGAVGALAVLGTSPAGIDVFPRSGNGYGAGTFNALDVAVGAPSGFTEFRDPTSCSVDFAVL